MINVSVVIRTKNEEQLIGRTLEMVFRQTRRDVEVIVVDSRSTDRTLDIVKAFPVKLIEIPAESFTFGYALNVGCQAASGELVVLLSAHAVPCNECWMASLLEPFVDQDVAATWGSEHGWYDSLESLPHSLSRRISLCKDNFGPHNGVWGFSASNAAIRLSRWRSIPFDERLPASEDKHWAWAQIKSGFKVVYVPEAAVYHTHRLSPWQVYRRAWREHWAVAEFMPELKFGLWDVVKGVLKRPRAGLWREAKSVSIGKASVMGRAWYLGYRLLCRFMYYWGLYVGLKAGRIERARSRARPKEGRA